MDVAVLSPAITTDFVDESYYNVQAFGLAKSLVRRGHNLTIYTARKRGDPPCRCLYGTRMGAGFGIADVKYVRSVVPLPRRELLTPNVLREIRGETFDIVQVAEDNTLTSFMIGALRESFRGKFVISQGIYRTPANFSAMCYSLAGNAAFSAIMRKSADLVIAKTSAARKYMESRGYKNIIIIPVGVDTNAFTPLDRISCRKELGIDADEKVLLHVGIIAPHRNIESCIVALSRLYRKGHRVRLLLVGAGFHQQQLSSLARTLGVENRVRFLGAVPNSRLPSVFSASDVTLLPMRRDALFIFGMVIPESLACGVPVVSTPVPAAIDHIHEGVTGHIVDHEDSMMLTKCLDAMFTSEGTISALSRSSREYCVRNLDWDVLADRYVDAYDSVV